MKVSICTPTYNRRSFIPSLIHCVKYQDYTGPIEWVIVDDGTDPIDDLVSSIPCVKYIRLPTKYPLGTKRNIMHANCTGDILVYMDDDDYYPPTRVSHAVSKLTSSSALCAGSSEIHILFHDIGKIVQFGPYNPNHATAGTFAFKKELLTITSYENDACMAEEKSFLKNYTIPMVQLDPFHVILVVSHKQNTFDKKSLLDKPSPYMKETSLTIHDFIQDPKLLTFFNEDIRHLTYVPDKPDVIAYKKYLDVSTTFSVKIEDKVITGNDIITVLNQQQQKIRDLTERNKTLQKVVNNYIIK
jgi:glycosyltransferase involved in cell wall biosynthesis